MQENSLALKKLIEKSRYCVFFGGAGVSTESGIADFRSVDGLYQQKYIHPPEVMLSHTFYEKHPKNFFEFYKTKMIFPQAKPNMAHIKLAELEAKGKIKAVITQNIDGLHQMAGSNVVLELHGSVKRNYCELCHAFYSEAKILESNGIPRCSCGGKIKPDVVLYEEGLDSNITHQAIEHIRKADLLIVGGTSLIVYPAAGMLDYFKGENLVLINRTETSKDDKANYIFRENIGEIFSEI
ncbi:MAG: NAD-dependent protein deacylase [Fusobacteria bacterium]|nr:NAD-dependent protein deacylase [Fusobacteriota bacterium]